MVFEYFGKYAQTSKVVIRTIVSHSPQSSGQIKNILWDNNVDLQNIRHNTYFQEFWKTINLTSIIHYINSGGVEISDTSIIYLQIRGTMLYEIRGIFKNI